MGKIVDISGKPLHQKVEGEARVLCDMLVENSAALKIHKGVTVMTPKGPALVPVEQALSGILFNLYRIMNETKQRRMVIQVEDVSAETVLDKQLLMCLMDLPKEEVEENENIQD